MRQRGGQRFNLAKFEEILANISDCIIIFPESAGSFAETGYFSKTNIKNRTLIVNCSNEQGESFLNLGPIDLVSKASIFGQTVLLNSKNPDFSIIKERLKVLLAVAN